VDLTKSDFEDAMGDWTAAHDLRARAKRKWDAGIRPGDDALDEWNRIISEPEMGTWSAAHDLRSRAKRKSEAGIELTGDVESAWDRIIAEQPERTIEVLEAELDAIDKERLALDRDLELGTSPGWQARMPISRVGEVIEGGVGDFGDYSVRAPRVTDFQTDVTDTRMPVATGIPYGVPSDMDEGMAEGYLRGRYGVPSAEDEGMAEGYLRGRYGVPSDMDEGMGSYRFAEAPGVTSLDEGMGSYRFAEAPGVTSLDEGMAEGYMTMEDDFSRMPFPLQAPFLGEISQREADVAGIIPRIEKPILPTDMPPRTISTLIIPRIEKPILPTDMPPRTISTLPLKLQEALTTGVGVADAFIAAQQAKVLAEAGAEDKIKKSILDKVYDWGGALPSAKEIVEKAQDILDSATTPEVLAALDDPFRKEGVDVETDFDAYARAQQLANEYRDMYQEKFSDFPGVTGVNAVGSQMAIREPPTWEERYPLAPQGSWRDEIDTSLAGLADRQLIDPHPLASNVDLGAYYSIPPDQRHKIYKPTESRWDVSKSGGSVWDRERRAAIGGLDRGMVDEFGQIQAEQDAIDIDDAQIRADAQMEEYTGTPLFGTLDAIGVNTRDMYGQLHGPLLGGITSKYAGALGEVDDWRKREVSAKIVDEDAPINLIDQTPFAPYFDEDKSGYGVGGDVQEFMYNGERWYLTKQGEYAKQYKKSELVTPWQSLPADFF